MAGGQSLVLARALGSSPDTAHSLQRDDACKKSLIQDLGRVSDSLSEKVFKEKVDQIEQTIRFCDFKISKGKQLSITEIVELRKDGDPSLANLMDVALR